MYLLGYTMMSVKLDLVLGTYILLGSLRKVSGEVNLDHS